MRFTDDTMNFPPHAASARAWACLPSVIWMRCKEASCFLLESGLWCRACARWCWRRACCPRTSTPPGRSTTAQRPGAWTTGRRASRRCAPSVAPLARGGGETSSLVSAACFESPLGNATRAHVTAEHALGTSVCPADAEMPCTACCRCVMHGPTPAGITAFQKQATRCLLTESARTLQSTHAISFDSSCVCRWPNA